MEARPRTPWPQLSCLFPLIALLSLAVLPFLGASELDLAAKLTMIYGPGSPQKGYFRASVNMGVKGISYIWKAVEAST